MPSLQRLDKACISTDRILNRLGIIANTDVEAVEARDVINASKVILQVNGALQPKASTDNRIVVNIGFLNAGTLNTHSTEPHTTAAPDAIAAEVLSQTVTELRPQAQLSWRFRHARHRRMSLPLSLECSIFRCVTLTTQAKGRRILSNNRSVA
jgi:hypothetical protein